MDGATEPWLLAIVAASGLAAGFINAMAGGGSLLTLPALMLAGLPADLANATNRLTVVAQSVSGIAGYAHAGKLDRGAIGPSLAPTALGALLGALAASYAPPEILKPILLATLVAMAIVMVIAPRLAYSDEGEPTRTLRERPWATLGLFGAGVYGGFVQAGVGFVLLAVLGGMLRYDLVRANALKLVATLVFGVVALGVFVARDQVVWLPAIVLAVSGVLGSLAGVRFALRAPPRALRWIVFATVVAMCIAALWR